MSLKHLDVQPPWFSHESSQSCPPNGTQNRVFQNLRWAGMMANPNTDTQQPAHGQRWPPSLAGFRTTRALGAPARVARLKGFGNQDQPCCYLEALALIVMNWTPEHAKPAAHGKALQRHPWPSSHPRTKNHFFHVWHL